MSKHKADKLRVAVAGLGTVGASVVSMIQTGKSGTFFDVRGVSARDKTRQRPIKLDGLAWADDAVDLADPSQYDVVVELIGGADGVALDLVEKALARKIHVVTANKALVAKHGGRLAELARENGVQLRFEAAVAGVVPIIKTIRETLASNQIQAVYGILNGTCNYILTEMGEKGLSFETALKQAQELGYAEADPAFDINGTDTAHKSAILSSLAYDHAPVFDSVYIEGIEAVTAEDIAIADRFGYKIKLLGTARRVGDRLAQWVFPCMVAREHPIAKIDGSFNAVFVKADRAGDMMLSGRGAGGDPTASAVLSDLYDIARGAVIERDAGDHAAPVFVPVDERVGRYYLNFHVKDVPGVLSRITAVLSENGLSVYSLLQEQKSAGSAVPIIIMTHDAMEKNVARALSTLGAEAFIVNKPRMIRIAEL